MLGCRKETHCEFCDSALPDWKQTLTPTCGANAPAVMNVNFDGRTYSFEVKPGPDGYRQFTEAIRRAFNLPEDSELNITFTCDEPSTTWEPEPQPSAPCADADCDVVMSQKYWIGHSSPGLLLLGGSPACFNRFCVTVRLVSVCAVCVVPCGGIAVHLSPSAVVYRATATLQLS